MGRPNRAGRTRRAGWTPWRIAPSLNTGLGAHGRYEPSHDCRLLGLLQSGCPMQCSGWRTPTTTCSDPIRWHPSLHFKHVGRLWSVRVGKGYRALAVAGDDGPVWFWIGSHAEYDRIVATA